MNAGSETDAGWTQGDRRSRRLRDYDYAQAGAYFVTLCTRDRICLFGEVIEGVMTPNEAGEMVGAIWRATPDHFPGVSLDEFVVMPNHLHGILMLAGVSTWGACCAGADPLQGDRRRFRGAIGPAQVAVDREHGAMNRAATLGEVVRAFKARASRAVGRSVWQRNYYDHIVRDEESLNQIRQYIRDNPARWAEDHENPIRAAP